MKTYASLLKFLNRRTGRNVPGIRATRVVLLEGGSIAVRFHHTNFVTAHQNGTFTLRHGGYQVITIKSRINAFSPAKVHAKNFEWFLSNGAPFESGMTVGKNGLPVEAIAVAA